MQSSWQGGQNHPEVHRAPDKDDELGPPRGLPLGRHPFACRSRLSCEGEISPSDAAMIFDSRKGLPGFLVTLILSPHPAPAACLPSRWAVCVLGDARKVVKQVRVPKRGLPASQWVWASTRSTASPPTAVASARTAGGPTTGRAAALTLLHLHVAWAWGGVRPWLKDGDRQTGHLVHLL